MIKKMMVGLLIAMVGVCFADYKSEFSFNLNDPAKIDKLLAEATAAKNTGYIKLYSNLKLLAGKDDNTISYEEFKKMLKNDKYKELVPQFAVQVSRFNKFILNVVNDSEFNTTYYVKKYYPASLTVMNVLGIKTWREKFLNINSLKFFKDVQIADRIFNNYQSNSSSLSATEIKADCAVFKRAWYMNMTNSEEWKKLLVQIELMIKSVE
jgi:hypothetical protein